MQDKIEMYLELIMKAPKRAVTMSPLEKHALMSKHIKEAKIYLPYVKSGDKVLDIGTGVGFPGIPLSIMMPSASFYLVDRKKTHIDFLSQVKTYLDLENVKLFNIDANDLKKLNEHFDVVCARAVNRIRTVLSWSLPVTKETSLVVLGKKTEISQEIEDAKNLPFEILEIVPEDFGQLVVYKRAEKQKLEGHCK
ncbi:MAG: 16S rRNA (guanine(527)-N(7))-methyltransferase RsmG [Caldisericaceae bacterium]